MTSTYNPFIDADGSFSEFKPLPLPDDVFGFDPTTTTTTNQQIDPYGPPPYVPEVADEDLENILLDLGIADNNRVQQQISQPQLQQQQQYPIQQQQQQQQHERKVSGSGIFGFVGTGDDTMLSLPGLPPTPVTVKNKKFVYDDISRFDNLDYSKPSTQGTAVDSLDGFITSTTSIITAPPPMQPQRYAELSPSQKENIPLVVPKNNRRGAPDYYFTGDQDGNYRFPKVEATPPVTSTYSAQDLQQLRTYHTDLEGYGNPNDGLIKKGELQATPTTKQFEEIDKLLNYSGGQSKEHSFSLDQQLKPSLDPSSINTSPSKDSLISPTKVADSSSTSLNSSNAIAHNTKFSTPSKLKVKPFISFTTPTPIKQTSVEINWTPTLITKKNTLSEQIIRAQQIKSPSKKKKPTITSTLACGALDKYFVGPNAQSLYICKYQNCEKEFTRISNIRAHIQTHLCDRPFVCDKCQKAFVRNHDLRRHMKGHGEFTFTCPCGKKFPRQDAMRRHRLRNICIGGMEEEPGRVTKKRKKASNSTTQGIKRGRTKKEGKGSSTTPHSHSASPSEDFYNFPRQAYSLVGQSQQILPYQQMQYQPLPPQQQIIQHIQQPMQQGGIPQLNSEMAYTPINYQPPIQQQLQQQQQQQQQMLPQQDQQLMRNVAMSENPSAQKNNSYGYKPVPMNMDLQSTDLGNISFNLEDYIS